MGKEKYPGCYYCDNYVDHPDQFGLLHLGFPRCFILIRDMAAFDMSDYDDFRAAIGDIQWLDPAEEWSEEEKEAVIVKLWNFAIEAEQADEDGYYDAMIDFNTDER
jgi:hypothetical protein